MRAQTIIRQSTVAGLQPAPTGFTLVPTVKRQGRGAVRRKGIAIVIASVCVFALSLAPAASAHTQTVAPPGLDEPVMFMDPIAVPWVQGHCRAQAPAVSWEASGGVAGFFPNEPLPCPPVPNPGGEITGP
jgi:hypothetical protein